MRHLISSSFLHVSLHQIFDSARRAVGETAGTRRHSMTACHESESTSYGNCTCAQLSRRSDLSRRHSRSQLLFRISVVAEGLVHRSVMYWQNCYKSGRYPDFEAPEPCVRKCSFKLGSVSTSTTSLAVTSAVPPEAVGHMTGRSVGTA